MLGHVLVTHQTRLGWAVETDRLIAFGLGAVDDIAQWATGVAGGAGARPERL
ncbi:hypothetical protein ACFW9O_30375 [Streptomyces sp. NPDC059499]|uniref:hypothetical protein n=1 Tax=Streptomyces sp. NPDC059499 TaxID=3346852 RepID=UPI0036905FA1